MQKIGRKRTVEAACIQIHRTMMVAVPLTAITELIVRLSLAPVVTMSSRYMNNRRRARSGKVIVMISDQTFIALILVFLLIRDVWEHRPVKGGSRR
jgi:hypothetical protein